MIEKLEPTELDCRMLCTCNVADSIRKDGSINMDHCKIYYDHVDFVSPPKTFVAGIDKIDACLVGTNSDGVLLAFRGTVTNIEHPLESLLDWLNDFLAIPMPVPTLGEGVKVHTGFWTSLETFWKQILEEVDKQRTVDNGKLPLFITGHSKGGALANLAAIRFAVEEKVVPTVVTVAAPLSGNDVYCDVYNKNIPDDERYEFGNDVVPFVPPNDETLKILSLIPEIKEILKLFPGIETWNYKAVGHLRFIKWDKNTIVGPSLALTLKRYAELEKAFKNKEFEEILYSHLTTCNPDPAKTPGFGYMPGICHSCVCGE